ncbi:MAG: universal stress protein [Anaerolineae bacterium]
MNVTSYAAPKKILIAVEDSPQLEAVVSMISRIKWPGGSTVYLLAVVPEQLPLMDTRFEARSGVDEAAEIHRWRGWAATKLMADQIVARLRVRHLFVERAEICAGPLVELALERSIELAPDVIVLGAKPGGGPGNIWLNPSPGKLAQCAPHSVLVVRPSKPVYPLHTLLAVSNSPEAWQAINFVRTLSLPDWARVTLLYLCGEGDSATAEPSQDAAEQFAAEVISHLHEYGVAVRWLQRPGHPTRQLLSVAREQEANLIVIGADETMPVVAAPRPGGMAQSVVKHAPCSVLVVRQ